MKMKNRMFKWATFIFALTIVCSCTDDEGSDVGIPASGLRLVFEDNFEGTAGQSINTNIWNFDIGNGVNGWGNQESQFYTDRPENISLDGQGNMVITARREPFQGFNFTSARINTRGNFDQQFGRFEARIQMPGGRGVWPAFWMLGANIEIEPDDDPNTVIWPFPGEIDITEQRGQEPFRTHGSMHGPGYSAGQALTSSFDLDNDRFDEGFHEYAIEWRPEQVEFFIDGVRFNTISREDVPAGGDWVFDDVDADGNEGTGQPFFILLNVAVEGTFVGDTTPTTAFPQEMIVDYVRVYEIIN